MTQTVNGEGASTATNACPRRPVPGRTAYRQVRQPRESSAFLTTSIALGEPSKATRAADLRP